MAILEFILKSCKKPLVNRKLRSKFEPIVSLTGQSDRDDSLLMRARYVELLRALQRTAEHNPETVDALEQILPETAAEAVDHKRWPSAVHGAPFSTASKHHAA
jgi:hypothetical protein